MVPYIDILDATHYVTGPKNVRPISAKNNFDTITEAFIQRISSPKH